MQVDFKAALMSLDGEKHLKEINQSGGEEEDLTLKSVCINALLGATDNPQLKGTEKLQRFTLAQQIEHTSVMSLTSEDITLLKKLIGENFGPLIVGRAYEILDPSSVKKVVREREEVAVEDQKRKKKVKEEEKKD